jgi:hypothetical protein
VADSHLYARVTPLHATGCGVGIWARQARDAVAVEAVNDGPTVRQVPCARAVSEAAVPRASTQAAP